MQLKFDSRHQPSRVVVTHDEVEGDERRLGYEITLLDADTLKLTESTASVQTDDEMQRFLDGG